MMPRVLTEPVARCLARAQADGLTVREACERVVAECARALTPAQVQRWARINDVRFAVKGQGGAGRRRGDRHALFSRMQRDGLTRDVAAQQAGVSVNVVKEWEQATGLRFKAPPRDRPVTLQIPPDLTDQDRDDLRVLIQKGGYSLDEALAIIRRPRVAVPLYRRAA